MQQVLPGLTEFSLCGVQLPGSLGFAEPVVGRVQRGKQLARFHHSAHIDQTLGDLTRYLEGKGRLVAHPHLTRIVGGG